MHPRVRQLHDLLMEIREDNTIPIQDAFIMIGLLKVGESMMMLKSKGNLFPEEKK